MSKSSFKRAVQPDRPGSKTLSAISPPPCERGVPLYPLRYGVSDQPINAAIYPTLSVEGYPELKAGKAYGLRVLRPSSYVYLFYFRDGRMLTRHYQVTMDLRFAPLWWTEADYNDEAPGRHVPPDIAGSTLYLLAPEASVAQTVYVLMSDTILTHATLWKIEQDTNGLRRSLATEVKPEGGTDQRNAFDAVLLGASTIELLSPGLSQRPRHFPWSEVVLPERMATSDFIFTAMHRALVPRKDIKPLAVVLNDFLGMASELNQICAMDVARRDRYQASNKHRLQSAALVTSYFKHAEKSYNDGGKKQEIYEALQRQRKLVDVTGAGHFSALYEKEVKTFDEAINRSGTAAAVWARLMNKSGLVGKALELFDLSCASNASDYEQAVLNCLATTPYTEAGLEALSMHINESPEISPVWRALGAGNASLMSRLNTPLTIAKRVFDVVDKVLDERPGTVITELLSRLIWPSLARAPKNVAEIHVRRLRHVAELRFGVVIGRRDVPLEQFNTWALELQGYMELGELQARWGIRLGEDPAPHSGHKQQSVVQYVEIWEWETVSSNAVVNLPQSMPAEGNPLLRNLKKMQEPAGTVFSGIGAGLAIWGVRNSHEALQREENFVNKASMVGAYIALVSASVEVTTLALSSYLKSRGNAGFAIAIKNFGIKWASTVAGTISSIILAFVDGFRAYLAYEDGNPEQARLYLLSAIAGSVIAFSTLALGAKYIGLTAIAIKPSICVILALVAVGVIFYLAFKIAEVGHGPVEILLKHSAWGWLTPKFSFQEEMNAWNSIQFSPQITARWESGPGAAGTLWLRCTLPGFILGNEDFRALVTVELNGQPLRRMPAEEALATSAREINLDTHFVIAPLTDGKGAERGWQIAMHEDAHVKLEYLYRPDTTSRPTFALQQPDAPEPLVFTSTGWLNFHEINPDKLAPVRKPE